MRLRAWLIALGLLAWSHVFGASLENAEPYTNRPDILQVQAQKHPELPGYWKNLKRGHLEAVAQLLEVYPDYHIYFLARDSELLFDLARLLTRNDKDAAARIHLLNVSRANMQAEHIKEYLAQEGISEITLKQGRKILFVDTGFSGTIPRTLEEYLPKEYMGQIKTHLMASSNRQHPSTRVFLTSLNSAAAQISPSAMHESIVDYERMPRYTARSDRFERINGQWVAMSPVTDTTQDGLVSKESSYKFIQDLAAYSTQADALKLFNERRLQYKTLRESAQGGDRAGTQKAMQDLLKSNPHDNYLEALVRDFIEIHERNIPWASAGLSEPIRVEDVGLVPVAVGFNGASNKSVLIQKFPQWKSILENPETAIKKLLHDNDYSTLSAITDVLHDYEFMSILTEQLGLVNPPTQKMKNFVGSLIESGQPPVLHLLAQKSFAWAPQALAMKDEIRALIQTGDPVTLHNLIFHYFSKPFAQDKELFQLIIEKSNETNLKELIKVFSKPHTAVLQSELRLALEKVNDDTFKDYVADVFFRPHTIGAQWDDLRKLVNARLEKIAKASGKPFAPLELSGVILNSPAFQSPPKQMNTKLAKGDHVVTPQGRSLLVLESLYQGQKASTYKVQDEQGNVFWLKVVDENDALALERLKHEGLNRVSLEKHFRCADTKEQAHQFVLKEWYDGRSAAQIVAAIDERATHSTQLIISLRNRGLFEEDVLRLNAHGLIRANGQWIIVDSSIVDKEETLLSVLEHHERTEILQAYACRSSLSSLFFSH